MVTRVRANAAKAAVLALLLAACAPADWKPGVVADAEKRMRDEMADPAAQFSRVQVTGDDRTGQTCGYVYGRFADGLTHVARFTVYIDTPAPFVDGGLGRRKALSREEFEEDWQADCVKEGYKA
jgi:hypothetical protein